MRRRCAGCRRPRAALLIAPMAIANGVLAPFVGMIVDRYHPRPVLGFGFSVLAIALTWLSFEMAPDTPIWRLVLPFGAIGVGMAFVWSPLTATATRNLPPQLAGAGSAVYNSIRQLGAVLGSAGMAAFMTWRISAEMPPQGVRRRRGRRRHRLATARIRARAVLGRDVAVDAAARVHRVVRDRRRAVLGRLRAFG